MRYKYYPVLMLLLTMVTFSSCKKDGFNGLTDTQPEVPVTVTNVYDFRPSPTVKASKAENKITITLEIPASSGRKIREITKIAAAVTANYTVIYNSTTVGTSALWSNTPIPVNGTTYTFTTTFDEYKTKTGVTATPASNALLGRDFYFLLTLDDGQQLVPRNTRVWVVD
jgi:hypothetical protein